MYDAAGREADAYLKLHQRRRRCRRILAVLSAAVMLCVFYVLALPAVTMTKAVHTHEAGCYTQIVSTTERRLQCTFAQRHADAAYIVHQHEADCYSESGELLCPLDELATHTHTEACMHTPEPHVHTEDCYTLQSELICAQEEEDESHTHGEACYAQTKTLMCGFADDPSGAGAPEPVLICGRQEIVLHTHTEECYDEAGMLVCEMQQVLEHQHDQACFEWIEVPADTQMLTCTNSSPEHVHGPLCYGSWELTCGLEEGEPLPGGGSDTAENEPDNDADAQPPADQEPENSDGQLLPDNAGAQAAETLHIYYYVFVNGERRLAADDNLPRTKDQGRYFLTAAELETIYGVYGFRSDTFSSQLFFPHTVKGDETQIWADTPPYPYPDASAPSEYRVPLGKERKDTYVYYLPRNTAENPGYFTGNASWSDPTLIAQNTFYSATLSGPAGASAGESGVQYVLSGQTLRVSLTEYEGYVWRAVDLEDGTELQPDSAEPQPDGKMLYTFETVRCPIRISAVTADSPAYLRCTVRYTTNTLAAQIESLSTEVPASAQYVITEGSINGLNALSEQIELGDTDTYTLRMPDKQRIGVGTHSTVQDKRLYYNFKGWRVKITGELLAAGEPMTAMQLSAYETAGVIELEAVWSGLDDRGMIPTVNFYLCLTCEIMDNHSEGFKGNPIENFTQSVFAAGVLGSDGNENVRDEYMPIANPTDEQDAHDVDAWLRRLTTEPYDGLSLTDFPSDQEVFAAIRANGSYSITIEGVKIPPQYLTTDYFHVRWYVFKYHQSDGWHIDGVLVAKTGKLKVTKSFSGDAEAIRQIKAQTGSSEYVILADDSKTDSAEDQRLSLNAAADEMRDGYTGYSSYDPQTDTYTWLLTGHVDGHYTFRERGYLLSDAGTQVIPYYRVMDESGSASWSSYSEDTPVVVQMISYPDDEPDSRFQTLAFSNYYIRSGTLTVHKLDTFSRRGLADVCFRICTQADMQPLTLYRKPGTGAYSFARGGEFTERMDGTLITDLNGDLFLTLQAGTYVLEEQFPEGYSGAARIVFTVDGSGLLQSLLRYDASGADLPDPGNETSSGVGTPVLVIGNESELLTTVTAVKDWGPVPEARQEPVTVSLLCNGSALSRSDDAYTQTLSAENQWTYVWNDLPLFIDGKLARYSLLEVMIGDTAYESGVDSDGYRDYQVTCDEPKYREAASGPYSGEAVWIDDAGVYHYARHVLLTVHNRLDGSSGLIMVHKAFETLDGSALERLDGRYTFGLYDTPDADGAPLQTASVVYANGTVTPADGAARFSGLTIGRTYYVFEMDDSGVPIRNGAHAVADQKPFFVTGSGADAALSIDAPTVEITITNRTDYAELPMTGGSGTGIFYAAGAALCAGAAVLLAGKRRRQRT